MALLRLTGTRASIPTSPFSDPLPKSWPKHAKTGTLHVISLAHFVLTHVRGFAVNSPIHRVRLAAERDRLDSEVALLREEIRIKDARMAALAPHRRPHYSPTERMAILELMAARGWSKAEAGRRFLVIDDTIASWSGRIEEDEPGALVKSTVPVNKFPDFVAAMVIKLKTLFPMMGRRRIAGFLSRAGLHIAASTVRRMLNRKPAAQPPAPLASAENPDQPPSSAKPCTVIANYPNHVWGLDTTAVPTSAGFWTSWLPLSFAQSWPFCWWVAVVVDHWSRRSLGLAPTPQQGSRSGICRTGASWLDFAKGERLFSKVRKGWSKEKVREFLGAPASCTPTHWRYVAGRVDGPEVTYVYVFANNLVERIDESAVACRFRL